MQKKTRKALKEESKEEMNPLLDDVSRALLTHLKETGKSSEEDLLEVDAVSKESASFIDKMIEYGLLKVGDDDTVSITKKGKEILALLEESQEVFGYVILEIGWCREERSHFQVTETVLSEGDRRDFRVCG